MRKYGHNRLLMGALVLSGSFFVANAAWGATIIIANDLTTGGTASAGVPQDFPMPNETPDKAFDDLSSTKGLIFNDVANDNATPYEDVTANNFVFWQYDFSGTTAHTVLLYSLTTANDSPDRDPRDFFLEGSNDGSSFTVVDTVTGMVWPDGPDVDTTADRFETQFFTVDSPQAFQMYRVRIIETSGTTNDRPQIAEIQMFLQVPEPASLTLLGIGGAALLSRRRR